MLSPLIRVFLSGAAREVVVAGLRRTHLIQLNERRNVATLCYFCFAVFFFSTINARVVCLVTSSVNEIPFMFLHSQNGNGGSNLMI